MAIWSTTRPSIRCWSKNPISYYLAYNGIAPGVSIQVRIIDVASNAPLGETLRFTVQPGSGLLIVNDIEKIIDPYLYYAEPIPYNYGGNNITDDAPMRKKVYLSFREYSITNPNNAWINDNAYPFTVFKGGIGDMTFKGEAAINYQWQQHLFFPNTDGHAHPWLSFRGLFANRIHAKEWRWLLYLHLESSLRPAVQYRVWYTDGSYSVYNKNISAPNTLGPFTDKLLRIPVGIDQASLNPAGKTVLKYSVVVWEYSPLNPSPQVFAFMDFEVDNRPVHDFMNLFYRNSVGGLETIFLTGVSQPLGGKFTKREFERNRTSFNSTGANNNYGSEGIVTFTANTGYMSKRDLLLHFDLFNNTEWCGVYYRSPFQEYTFYPMKVPEQEMPAIDSEGFLHSHKIEFETAGSFARMPRQIFNFI